MRPNPGEQAPPEPDLTTQDRPRNVTRLLNVVNELDVVADVAAGKLIQSIVGVDWLRPLAAKTYGQDPAPHLIRWLGLFSDELETVRRARNNVVWGEFISDDNVAAAVQIAETILNLAKSAPAEIPDA